MAGGNQKALSQSQSASSEAPRARRADMEAAGVRGSVVATVCGQKGHATVRSRQGLHEEKWGGATLSRSPLACTPGKRA